MRYKNQIAKKEEEETSTSSTKKGKEDSFFKLTMETRSVYEVTKCHLVESPEDFVFSGTDNGIINMSTTTAFNFDGYKFHLKLYNRYQILKEENIDLQENKHYLDLPPQKVINSAGVDVGFSHRRVRKKLERAKKNTSDGKEVSEAEVLLSKTAITTKKYLYF